MSSDYEENNFGISKNIMIMAIASLLGVTILIFLLYFYSNYLLRRQERRRRRIMLLHHPLSAIEVAPIEVNSSGQHKKGLDRSIIASLPMFMYKSTDGVVDNSSEGIECTVCLNNIVQEAMVMVLPNCKHMFHAECIDMWLNLNTTCPICRTMAEPRLLPEHSGLASGIQPTAPPPEKSASIGTMATERNGGSSSRQSSFGRMFGRERSLSRIQNCEEVGAEDQERH